MSHKVELKTRLDNKKYILDALSQLGYKVTEAKNGESLSTKSQFKGVATNADIIVNSKNGKNINSSFGFRKEKDNSYSVVGDFWGTDVTQDEFMSSIQMKSKKLETVDSLSNLGFDIKHEVQLSQELHLTFSRYV